MTREELYQRYGEGIGVAAAVLAPRFNEGGYRDNSTFTDSPSESESAMLDRAERLFQNVAERAGLGTMEPRRG